VGYTSIAALALGFNGPLASIGAAEIDLALNRELTLRKHGRALDAESAALRAPNPLLSSARHPHVLVFVIESYGRAVFDKPAFAPLRASGANIAARLEAAGYALRSRYLDAPVFGGSSWLANVTLLCSAKISSEMLYESLHRSRVRCLPSELADAGYRSIYAAANTTRLEPRIMARLPFDVFYTRDSFGYRGPRFTWSYMPDQFVLHVVHARELSPLPRQPVFVHFALTSSHHPWRKVPPIIDDWAGLGDGSVFSHTPGVEFEGNRFVTGDRYGEAYGATIEYSLTVVADYLEQLPTDADVLAVVLGDHQPRAPIAEHSRDPWHVPVHVLSRRHELVDGFGDLGFTPGLVPRPDAAPPGLAELPSQLFRGLAAGMSMTRRPPTSAGDRLRTPASVR
jgi:hypothetical protein